MRITFLKTIFLFLVFSVLVSFSIVNAQTASPTPVVNQQKISDLQNEINDLENKVNDLRNQQKTLASQISVMDNQIKLTQLRIDSTEQELTDLTLDIDTADKKIDTLQNSLEKLTKILIGRIVATYEVGTIQPFQILLSSDNVSNFFVRLNYLKIAQEHDKRLIFDTTQAKNDYSNQKEIFEDKKQKVESLQAQLEVYNVQLDQDKASKQKLLTVTQNDEEKYQEILARTRVEFLAIQGIIAGKGTEVEIGSVSEGQTIASIIPLPSCNSSGPHVHFIVKDGGSARNPFEYLKPVDYVEKSGGDTFNPSGSWEWPITPPIQFNQGYGSDTSYIRSGQSFYSNHNGIDISGPSYAVKAVKSGTLYSGSYSVGCVLPYMRVKHEDGKETLYLHVYSVL